MIPAKDLRIGNWVTVNNRITNIKTISEMLIEVVDSATTTHADQLTPLPITHELLEKAGFKQRGETALYDRIPLVGFTYYLETKRLLIHHPGNILGIWLHTDISYLHQLQNFFYCLIGYDLAIDL
jgi:hypothetical protein